MVGIKHNPQTTKSHTLDDSNPPDGLSAWNNEHAKGDIADVVNAFTLATLNTLISDATLDDSGDPRDPNAHALGGAAHSADTLANLNAKVSDGTVLDTAAIQFKTGALHAAADHENAGSLEIRLDDLKATEDNTDLDVSTSAHGLTPKLPNDSTKFLNGVGAWVNTRKTYSVIGTSNELRTSTTFALMPNMTLTFTTGANDILIMFSTGCRVEGFRGRFRLKLDGTVIAGGQFGHEYSRLSYGCVQFILLKSVSAAEHTVLVEWAPSNGSYTLRCNPTAAPDDYHRSLTVMELLS